MARDLRRIRDVSRAIKPEVSTVVLPIDTVRTIISSCFLIFFKPSAEQGLYRPSRRPRVFEPRESVVRRDLVFSSFVRGSRRQNHLHTLRRSPLTVFTSRRCEYRRRRRVAPARRSPPVRTRIVLSTPIGVRVRREACRMRASVMKAYLLMTITIV